MLGKRQKQTGSAGIAGAGLVGRLLALELSDRGWDVTLFDADEKRGASSCAHTGAGMLAPRSELETAESGIYDLGITSLAATLEKRGVEWLTECPVIDVKAGSIRSELRPRTFDWVFDCRGYGAKADFPDLRGVRGELIYLSAPEVGLLRPVRLMHPRYPLYIVPRDEHTFVVGATTVESEDRGPITVRSTLELLSAAHAVHPGFGEARIVETCVNLRPAFPDHCPRITCEQGLVRINGLYRHGFLVSPALVQQALDRMSWKYELTETSRS